MNRAQAGVLFVLFAVAGAAVGATPAVGTAAPTAGHSTAAASPAGTLVEADTVEFRVTVYRNTSARWTFTYTRVLENDSERRQFESFAEEFEANETAAYRDFRRQARGLAATGRNATGREMAAVDFGRSAGLGGTCVTQDCGTVRMSFTWEAFANRSGDRIVVGDVFGSGLYVAGDQEFVVEAGTGLAFASASPRTYNDADGALEGRRSITYQGEQSFSDRRPRVVLVPADDGGAGTGTGTGPAGDEETPDRGGGFPMMLVAGLVVVLVGTGAAVARWRGGVPVPTGSGGGDGAAAGEVSEPAIPEEELLTDEDRVLSLLEENGGRMKQVQIVEETGWSKSKVSMLLSEMEDDDEISKLRVGRENIISISGQEPEAAGSPHDED